MADPGKMEEGLAHEEGAPDQERKDKRDGKVEKEEDGAADRIGNDKEERVATTQVEQQNLEEQPLVKQKTKRIATLDAFRGLTVVVSALRLEPKV